MNFFPVYLVCFIIFIVWLNYEQRKHEKEEQKASDEFWAREEEANNTRKKDISHLPLLQVSVSDIPHIDTPDEEIEYNMGRIEKIIQSPMLDLSEYTNTDLKLEYGVANFNLLSEYDENYSHFLIALTNLARAYARQEHTQTAIDTYLLALDYGSQKISDYKELAALFLQQEKPEEVNALIQSTEQSSHPHKDSVIQSLRETMASYQ